jgi:hypothetical protein
MDKQGRYIAGICQQGRYIAGICQQGRYIAGICQQGAASVSGPPHRGHLQCCLLHAHVAAVRQSHTAACSSAQSLVRQAAGLHLGR